MSAPEPALPSPARRRALLTLLADDDPAVVRTIRDRLREGGEGGIDWLTDHLLDPDPRVRRRVRQLLDERAREAADIRFLAFILGHGEQFDLEEAVWRFVETRHPDVPVAAYEAQLDDWADRIRERIPEDASGRGTLEAVHGVLFGELGFRGNGEDYDNPENSYLNRIMDRRTGIPIGLSLVYLAVTRRLGLPVRGIGMPGHFLCRYQSPREEYYVDVFHQGLLLSRIDCVRRLKEAAVEVEDGLLAPVTPRRILQRMIANLHRIHLQRRQADEADRLQRYLIALAG